LFEKKTGNWKAIRKKKKTAETLGDKSEMKVITVLHKQKSNVAHSLVEISHYV